MEHGPLAAVLLVLALGLPVVMVLHRLRVGALVAYLFTGALAAFLTREVDGLQAIEVGALQPMAEIGAALLLFALGLEFDPSAYRSQMRRILIASVGQIVLTVMAGTGAGLLAGLPLPHAVAIGCCLTMSSTLFIMRGLDERGLRTRPEGRLVLGLSLVQDVALAPMIVLLSFILPNAGSRPWPEILIGMVLFGLATWWFRKVLATRLVARIAALKVPEIEVAFSVVIALGAAWLAGHAGLGLAFGAFCAGLALGGGAHRSTIAASIHPLQGLMAILFFIAIGMLFDPRYVIANPLVVGMALVLSLSAKIALAGAAFRLAGMDARSALGSGLLVGSIGEFSFVIASAAFGASKDPAVQDLYRLAVAVTCLGLALTPVLVRIAVRFLPRPASELVTASGDTVVVAGLGPVGNTVVEVLRSRGHPLLLVDRNTALLAPWQGVEGITCHPGRIEELDDWLPALGHRPALVVLTFPIADTSALVAQKLTIMDPDLVVVARSQYLRQCDTLTLAGVRHIICDEQAVLDQLDPLLDRALTEAGGQPRRMHPTLRTFNRLDPATDRIDKPIIPP